MGLRSVAAPVMALLACGVFVENAPARARFSTPVRVDAGGSPVEVVAADFDGDGTADLAVTNFGGRSVSVLLGRGDGSFRERVVSLTTREPWDIAVADLNGDGRPDLVTTAFDTPDGGVAVLLNEGAGRFRLDHVYLRRGDPESVVTADFNRDGIVDLVTATAYQRRSPTVLLGTVAGAFLSPRGFVRPQYSSELAAGDFNGDGTDDVVLDNTDRLLLYAGNGDGTFGPPRIETKFGAGGPVALADVNHDGNLDLAVAVESEGPVPPSTFSVALGNGDGSFRAGIDYPTVIVPRATVIADLDGDGNPDIMNSGPFGDPPIVRSGHGDGTFGNAQRLPGAGHHRAEYGEISASSDESGAVADFNRDGRPDLALVRDPVRTPGRADVFLNWTGLPAPPCVVHTLTRRLIRSARRELNASGCELGRVRYGYSRKTAKNRVISQRPANGTVLPSHSPVDIVAGRGPRH
jgi:hypothetical protein